MGETKALCIVCHKRAARYLNGKACRLCAVRTAAEGTREQFGLSPVHLTSQKRTARFVRIYNKMMLEGKRLKDIAEALGLQLQTVKNEARLLRRNGFHLEQSRRQPSRGKPPGQPISRTTRKGRPGNEHGGGKGGVTGCECKPCQDVRRANRRAWNAANKDKIDGYVKRHKDKKQSSSQPS